jgi:glucose/arabinose dehydrogenase
LESRQLFTVPTGFTESVVATGLNGPTTMAVAPDGRVFVALQNGNVRIVKDGVLLPTPFVNVREDSQEERGLLGLTFDPDFEHNHYVYLYYTKKDAAPLVAHNVVSRFVADGDVAVGGVNAGGEQVLFELPDVGTAIWHVGGALRFGPDGKLYVGVGEHQQPAMAQSLASPFGKILRINPDGSIPADNPFYNQTTGINRAIWAYGIRNPFSAEFEPETGRLFVNDVGGGRAEEIDEATAGANFGWPTTEGSFDAAQFPGMTNPLYAYRHNGDGACVIGGAFYEGVAPVFPRDYQGKYFFADFVQGWVRMLDPQTGAVADFASGLPFPVAVALGPDGAMWVLSHDRVDGGTANDGVLRRIDFTLRPPPAAVVSRLVFYNGSAFDGRNSSANAADDGAIATDKAALAPGQPASFANVTSYPKGINGVLVDVRGARGAIGAADFRFDVGPGPAGPFSPGPVPTAVTVRPGAGAGGSDRVTIVWPDRAIRNEWLRVTLKADAVTGLGGDDVFCFGNLAGEVGGAAGGTGALAVTVQDVTAVRRNRSALTVPVTSPYDVNRDGRVNALDLAATRAGLTQALSLSAAEPALAATYFVRGKPHRRQHY